MIIARGFGVADQRRCDDRRGVWANVEAGAGVPDTDRVGRAGIIYSNKKINCAVAIRVDPNEQRAFESSRVRVCAETDPEGKVSVSKRRCTGIAELGVER